MKAYFDFDLIVESEDLSALKKDQNLAEFFGLKVGTVSSDQSVIVGLDDFLFIYDGSNYWKSQLSGDAIVSDVDLNFACNVVAEYQRQCDARAMDFVFSIIPEKDIVYPEKSPNAGNSLSPVRSVHRYMQRLSTKIAYPLEEMLEAKKETRLYHIRDSHFNFFGGLIVANSVLKALNEDLLHIDDVPVQHTPYQDDLSVKWVQFEARRRQVRVDYHEQVLSSVEGHLGLHLKLTNETLSNESVLVIYGDSYSWNPDAGLARFMTRVYKTVHFIWKKHVDWDFIDSVRPDALVLQSAERFLVRGII